VKFDGYEAQVLDATTDFLEVILFWKMWRRVGHAEKVSRKILTQFGNGVMLRPRLLYSVAGAGLYDLDVHVVDVHLLYQLGLGKILIESIVPPKVDVNVNNHLRLAFQQAVGQRLVVQ